MKLNIVYDDRKNIKDFNNLNIFDQRLLEKLQPIPEDSCEHIIIGECLQMLSLEQSVNVLDIVASKIRMGGVINFSFINFMSICLEYSGGRMNEAQVSNLIQNTMCVIDLETVKRILDKNNVEITSIEYRDFFVVVSGLKK